MEFKKLFVSMALGTAASFAIGALSVQPNLSQQHHALIATCVEAWKFSAATVFSLSIASNSSRR